MSYGKKDVFFYGDYDARNMRPEKSRDLGGLQHFLTNFWKHIEKNAQNRPCGTCRVTFGVSYFEHRNLYKKTHLFCHMTLFFIDPENNPSHDWSNF